MTDAMQTIRTFLLKMISIGVYGSRIALTALDSLAGAPGEDVEELVKSIRDDRYGLSFDQATALIQARDSTRDERIRREYAGEIALLQKQRKEVHKLAHLRPVPTMIGSMLCNMLERHAVEMAKRADILTPEAANGQ